MFWVRNPVRVVSVFWKLSTIEEHRQDRSCLFRRGDYRNNGPNPEKLPGSSPGEDGFCSSETKYYRKTAQRTKLFVSKRRLQELRSQSQKLSWVRVSVKILGLGKIIISVIFNDTYRMIRPMLNIRAIKINTKYKHLSNFPVVTLRVLW
jgi:ribosomal protein L30/L7E